MARRKLFKTVTLDPPWNETSGVAKSASYGAGPRGADRHYPLLKTKEMPGVINGSGLMNFYPDAHMYMWVTKNFLKDGLWLMDQLGFRYVTMGIWLKAEEVDDIECPSCGHVHLLPGVTPTKPALVFDRFGMGRYFRGRFEPILFGVRGSGTGPDVFHGPKNLDDVVIASRQEHSRKPEEFFDKVEARSQGPYLEMFARGVPRDNWTAWGNEVKAA